MNNNNRYHRKFRYAFSGYPDLREVVVVQAENVSLNQPSLLSRLTCSKRVSLLGKSEVAAKNPIFHHYYMMGAWVESTLWGGIRHPRWESWMHGWLQTSSCSAEESSSRKTRKTRGLHIMGRRVEPNLREGLGKHTRKYIITSITSFFSSRPIFAHS